MPRGKLKGETTTIRRREILQAALKCFTSKGYSATSVADIQALSGASIGSIYHHFENKEGIALALYLEGLDDLHQQLLAVVKNNPPPEEGIKTIVTTYLDWFKSNPEWGYYLYYAANTEYLASQTSRFEELTGAFVVELFKWFLPYVEKGQLLKFDQALYEPLVIGPSRDYMCRWLLKQEKQALEEATLILAEAAWKVVRP